MGSHGVINKGERVERPAPVEAMAMAFTPLHASPKSASGRNKSIRMFALVATEVESGRRFAGHPVQPSFFKGGPREARPPVKYHTATW